MLAGKFSMLGYFPNCFWDSVYSCIDVDPIQNVIVSCLMMHTYFDFRMIFNCIHYNNVLLNAHYCFI
jgi:hypothetical protein